MATRTISNAGGNYNAIGTWVEGIVPVSGDDIVCTATSGQLTVNVTSGASTINFTNYVNTFTLNAQLTLSGGFTLVAGMTLAGDGVHPILINNSGTITSNGKTMSLPLSLTSSSTVTLADALTITALLTLGSGGSATVVNGFQINSSGGILEGMTTGTVSGTTKLNITGGTLTGQTSSGYLSLNIDLNGNVTFVNSSNTWRQGGTSTLRWVSGTTTTTGHTLVVGIAGTVTLDVSAVVWSNVTFSGNVGIVLSSDLDVDGTFSNLSNGCSTSGAGRMLLGGNITMTNGVNAGGTQVVIIDGTGTWSGSGDLGGAVTINTAGTFTIPGNVTKHSGSLTYTAGTVAAAGSTLTCGDTNSITFNCAGITWNNVTLNSSGTKTLSANLNVGGLLNVGSGSSTLVINGFQINVSGGLQHGSSVSAAIVQGTTVINMIGTGTVSNTTTLGDFRLSLTINTAGTITFGTSVAFRASVGTWTYTAGTVIATGAALTVTAAMSLNLSGATLGNVIINTAMTVTLSSTMRAAGTLTLPTGNVVFAGAGGFDVDTFSDTSLGNVHTLQSGNTYRVRTAIVDSSSKASAGTLQASTVNGTKAIFTVDVGATQEVAYTNVIDIDSSGGAEIKSYGGVFTRSPNWSQFPTRRTTVARAMVA